MAIKEEDIKTTKMDLLDCIHNLMAVVDTPLGRMHNKGKFAEEAREIGRKIMEDNNRSITIGG